MLYVFDSESNEQARLQTMRNGNAEIERKTGRNKEIGREGEKKRERERKRLKDSVSETKRD